MNADPFIIFLGVRMADERRQGLTFVLGRPTGRDEQADVITPHGIGRMTVRNVVPVLGITVGTARQDGRLAVAWLAGQLGGGIG
jgi:hypothetical protein